MMTILFQEATMSRMKEPKMPRRAPDAPTPIESVYKHADHTLPEMPLKKYVMRV